MERPTQDEATAPDSGVWRAAYERHGTDILAFLRCRAATPEDAEELLQETFVRAIRSGRLQDPSKMRSYLFTVAHNLLRNQQRSARVSPLVAATNEDPKAPDSTDRQARIASLCSRLAEVLQRLPEKHRRAFELAVIERMPYGEIAEQTGWSPSAVKVNVYRARRRILEEMTNDLEAGVEASR